MKHLLIICTILADLNNANAQIAPGMSHNRWEEHNSHHKAITVPANEFANTEMSVNSYTITFSDLPAIHKPAYAIITNAEGDFIKQAKITPEQNTIETRRLRAGLYFVTIVYRNKSKKAFTLNL